MGRGVETDIDLKRSSFICSYHGEHLSKAEGRKREERFQEMNAEHGDYIFFNRNICIDATAEDNSLGRLLNHSRRHPNCEAKPFNYKGVSYIILKAKHDIKAGTQLTFDYGERRKEILILKPWLNN